MEPSASHLRRVGWRSGGCFSPESLHWKWRLLLEIGLNDALLNLDPLVPNSQTIVLAASRGFGALHCRSCLINFMCFKERMGQNLACSRPFVRVPLQHCFHDLYSVRRGIGNQDTEICFRKLWPLNLLLMCDVNSVVPVVDCRSPEYRSHHFQLVEFVFPWEERSLEVEFCHDTA